MQISNRANGGYPNRELNKDARLTFSDGYITQVNALARLLTMAPQTISQRLGGGSKVGVRDVPPGGPNSFIFMQF